MERALLSHTSGQCELHKNEFYFGSLMSENIQITHIELNHYKILFLLPSLLVLHVK